MRGGGGEGVLPSILSVGLALIADNYNSMCLTGLRAQTNSIVRDWTIVCQPIVYWSHCRLPQPNA